MQSVEMWSKTFSVSLHQLFKPAGWGDLQLNTRQKTLGENSLLHKEHYKYFCFLLYISSGDPSYRNQPDLIVFCASICSLSCSNTTLKMAPINFLFSAWNDLCQGEPMFTEQKGTVWQLIFLFKQKGSFDQRRKDATLLHQPHQKHWEWRFKKYR